MLTIPYCLPIVPSSLDELCATLAREKVEYPYLEVWLDYLDLITPSVLDTIEDAARGAELIYILRRLPGAASPRSAAEREAILDMLRNRSVLVDLDVKIQQQELAYLLSKTSQPKTILSYHNFESTPTNTELDEIVDLMRTKRATIRKVATMCGSPSDALRLLLLRERLGSERAIVLGMGPFGAITRVWGTLWGNALIFAPRDRTAATAPGQLTRHELEIIFEQLKAAHAS